MSVRAHTRPVVGVPALIGILVWFSSTAVVACRQAQELQSLLADRARTPAPSSRGQCDLDLTEAKGDTVFLVLGFLDEYLGRRFTEGSDLIECFYDSEPATAAVFRRLVVRLAEEQGFDSAVRDEVIQGRTCFHSHPIADRLNSCYVYQMSANELAQADDGSYRRTASASLGRPLFMRSGHGRGTGNGLPDAVFHRRRALAYLAGAWLRYRRGSDFVFANAQEKARLVAQLLSDLGCRNVRLESTFGVVPQANMVHFQPTKEVEDYLNRTW